MPVACTIIARNYLAHARVLVASFRRHHPHLPFVVLLTDDEAGHGDYSGEDFQVLRLGEVGLPRREVAVLAAIYDATELATAVKPWLLKYLQSVGHGVIVYLDPDIKVFAPLGEALRSAGDAGVVLTPHTMVPIPPDPYRLTTTDLLASGAYNLGFIAVGPGAGPFLDWWWMQTRRNAISDPERHLFTDQRCLDLAPSLFDHVLLKDPTCNVAYWNLHGRELAGGDGAYTVDGRPLTFFHFSGFDHRTPWLLSRHQGAQPRILLSERPALAALCREYATDLARHGADEAAGLAYGWGRFGDGHELTRRYRRLYRAAVIEAEASGRPLPPGPFADATAHGFLDWLRQPVGTGPRPRLSRALRSIYQDRADLQRHYPDVEGADLAGLLQWMRGDGVVQEQLPPPLVPTEAEVRAAREAWLPPPPARGPGLNLVGYFHAELGIGEASRLLALAADHAGIPCERWAYGDTISRQQHPFETAPTMAAPHETTVLCVNADITPEVVRALGLGHRRDRFTAGLWFWEVEQFPHHFQPAFQHVDEVWGASRFICDLLGRISPKPVRHVRLPAVAPEIPVPLTREALGLPAGPLLLFLFDFLSVFERKNPVGLIAAFCRAFAPGEGPTLVIKSINGERRRADRERLRYAAAGRPDIRLIDDYWTAGEKNALLALCDAYVSLHRSEGLGLTMAEAMALGKPVIATGYSGNLDFMSEETSFLVGYRLTAIGQGRDPYPADGIWAEPDIEHAARLMRLVVDDPAEARRRGERGRDAISRSHGLEACGAALRAALDDIRAGRRRPAATEPAPAMDLPPAEPMSPAEAAPAAEPPAAGMPPEDETGRAAEEAGDAVHALLREAVATLPPAALHGSGPRVWARRVLYRVLRPYWWQQRRIDELLVEALDRLRQRADEDASR